MIGARKKPTEAVRRRVAAKNKWRCEACSEVLSAAFQIDHIIPLSEGGADDETNFQVLCPNCHATKTLNEAIERRARDRARQENFVRQKEREHEQHVRKKLEPTQYAFGNGKQCERCGESYFAIFKHKCPEIEKEVEIALQKRKPEHKISTGSIEENPFARFMFIKP